MASANDVTTYVLHKLGSMTAMKPQKLVYHSQAWSLVWDERPLFQARIEACANGPVVPTLYAEHRGQFKVSTWPKGDPKKLKSTERETIDTVLNFYGDKTSQWLGDLTHRERPWLDARAGFLPGKRGEAVITLASMAEYYGSLGGAQGT